MNTKMKQLKKINTEAKSTAVLSSVQHNLSTLNFEIFSHPSSKTTPLSALADLPKTEYPTADSNYPGNNVEDI